jgi:hypothetical protein
LYLLVNNYKLSLLSDTSSNEVEVCRGGLLSISEISDIGPLG